MKVILSLIKANVGSFREHTEPTPDMMQAAKDATNNTEIHQLAWNSFLKASDVTLEMRSQDWSGPAMLPYSELEYGGFKDIVTEL